MNSLVSLVVLSLALCVVAGSKLKCTPYGLALGCHPVGLARYTLIWIPCRAKYNRLSIHKSFLTQTLKLQRSSMPAASIKSCKFIIHTLKNVTLIKFFVNHMKKRAEEIGINLFNVFNGKIISSVFSENFCLNLFFKITGDDLIFC